MLDPDFVAVLRPYLPQLGPDAELPPDIALQALGLDSISAVAMVIDLESHLGVSMPDKLLKAETFATASSLWQALESVREPSP
jgi:acyl carrier protein